MSKIPEEFVIGPGETTHWRIYDAGLVDAELERVRYERDCLRDVLDSTDWEPGIGGSRYWRRRAEAVAKQLQTVCRERNDAEAKAHFADRQRDVARKERDAAYREATRVCDERDAALKRAEAAEARDVLGVLRSLELGAVDFNQKECKLSLHFRKR